MRGWGRRWRLPTQSTVLDWIGEQCVCGLYYVRGKAAGVVALLEQEGREKNAMACRIGRGACVWQMHATQVANRKWDTESPQPFGPGSAGQDLRARKWLHTTANQTTPISNSQSICCHGRSCCGPTVRLPIPPSISSDYRVRSINCNLQVSSTTFISFPATNCQALGLAHPLKNVNRFSAV